MAWGKEYSRPLPELLDGDDWEARNSGDLKKAYVDFKKKEFVVPFMGGPSGELVRAHEAMHVKISPKDHPFRDADFVTYQSVEDARVNQGLRLAGIDTDRGRVWKDAELEKIFEQPEFSTPLRMGEAYFATKGLAEGEAVREIIKKKFPDRPVLDICEELDTEFFTSNESKGYLTSDSERDTCVKELIKRMKEIETPQEQAMDNAASNGKGSKKGNITQAWQPGKGDKLLEDMELDIITAEEREEIKNALPYHLDQKNMEFYGSKPPGKMEIDTPKFDSFLKFKKVKSVKKTASDEGVIPSRMHRYATDMRVFSRNGRRRTSSAVLVDVSGSMSLSAQQIMEIIRLSPEGIVAIYSAQYSAGTLRVVAEKGRVYSRLKKGGNGDMGGSNVVDYPALQWLSKRPEKHKLWVSDGHVTGMNDSYLEPLYIRKIVNLVQKHKIIRVDGVKDLIDSGTLIDGKFDKGKEVSERMAARVTSSRS